MGMVLLLAGQVAGCNGGSKEARALKDFKLFVGASYTGEAVIARPRKIDNVDHSGETTGHRCDLSVSVEKDPDAKSGSAHVGVLTVQMIVLASGKLKGQNTPSEEPGDRLVAKFRRASSGKWVCSPGLSTGVSASGKAHEGASVCDQMASCQRDDV